MSRRLILLISVLTTGYLFIGGCMNENEELPSEEMVTVVPEQLPVEEPGSANLEPLPAGQPTPFIPEQPFSEEWESVSIVNVDDVVADPLAYDGFIGIRGIVSFVYSSDSSFVIIDVKEYELCGVVTCAINEMSMTVPPDQYSGELPNVEDEVVVYGKITPQGNTYLLDVWEVKRGKKTILKPATT